jgi:hypothetical protein
MSHHRHSPLRLPAGSSRRSSLLALAALQAAFFASASADTVAYWNFNSLSISTASAPGSGGVPTSIAANVGTASLSLAGWTGLVDDFAGSALNAQGSDPSGASLSVVAGGPTAAPFPGNGGVVDIAVDFTGFEDPIISFAVRGTSSGFDTGTWSYSIDGGAFTPVAAVNTATRSTTFAATTVDLSSYNDLDGADNVILRYTLSGATTNSGNNRIDNLLIEATSNVVDVAPPVASVFSPPDDSSGFDGTGYPQLTLTFNEPITLGTGNILVKKVADDSVAYTFDVTDFNQVDLNVSVLGLILPTPLEDDTAYYVEIPETAITDQAETPNAFAGFGRNDNGTPGDPGDDTFVWNFTTAPAATAPTVAINKYFNSPTPSNEIIELLVIGSGVPATTVDMRGMIVKDFTANMTGDGGGKYEFTTDPLWEAVPVGTQIILDKSGTSTDTDDADFVVRVGLDDPDYFTGLGGAFDISNTDMVMIKAAGSGAAGTAGGIHALGGGTAGSLFALFPGAKVLASSGTNGVIATNPTASVADFTEGSGATGGVALTSSDFGNFNNPTNRAYILGLRGIDPTDGDGLATMANATPASPFLGSTVFGRGLSGQSASITINSSNSSVTLSEVTVTVPTTFGTPGTVTLSGAGAAGASSGTAGQVITISGAAATDTDPLIVTIEGLSSPSPTLLDDDGIYSFAVSTTAGGTPSPIANFPAARVPIPIEALRDVNANGVPLDLGDIVAVEGVVTESDFGDGVSAFSGFLQDATAGINIFSPVNDPALVEGNRYVVLGTVAQFRGLSEIIPASLSDIFDLGADTPVVPQVLTLATLLADPEKYEGSLVTVQNLSYVSGSWALASNVVLQDSTPTPITVRIQAGAAVTGVPGGGTPYALINVTGIFGQFDETNPFTSGYQLMPRRQSDFAEGSASDFDIWAAATGATGGMTGDPDFDGRDNAFEYAFGLNPTSGGSVNPFVVPFDPATGLFTYTRRTASLTGLSYTYEYSTSLSDPWQSFTPAVAPVSDSGSPVEQITVTVPAALLAEPRLFIRVVTP